MDVKRVRIAQPRDEKWWWNIWQNIYFGLYKYV